MIRHAARVVVLVLCLLTRETAAFWRYYSTCVLYLDPFKTLRLQTDHIFPLILLISCGLPFLHPSEACIVNRVCRLASYYQYLNQFITCHVLPPAASPANRGDHNGESVRIVVGGACCTACAFVKPDVYCT